MRITKRLTRTVIFLTLGVSALFWIFLIMNPGNLLEVRHCAVTTSGPSDASWQMLLDMNPISGLISGWILMVGAMMLPKLIGPILHICERSLKHRRLALSVLFLLGYVVVWAIVGTLMIPVILVLNLLMPQSYWPVASIGVVCIIWQFSPVKQACLNRTHNHKSFAAFGWSANRGVVKFGLLHGMWCAASGWALMLLPMLLPAAHNLAMAVIALVMISEHLEHPQPARWRIDFRGKLFRILAAQMQMKLRRPERTV